jgi:YD repeat-containing protein
LIKQTNPNGVIISYEYDLLNRLVKTTNSDNSYIVLKNDELGNPIQHLVYNSENKLLKTQDVVYDKLSREIEKTIENITTKTKYDSV